MSPADRPARGPDVGAPAPGDADEAARARAVRRVLLSILALNWAVALAKGVAGLLGGSLSMVADAAHSTFDGASNVVGLVAVTFAARGPDREHPYGHRRFEVLGAAAIGVMLTTVVWGIVAGAVARLREPRAPDASLLQFAVLGATLAVNLVVTLWERRAGRALESPVLMADAEHTASDVLTTLAVVSSLVCARLGVPAADPLIALAIACYVGWIAVRLILGASNVLADRAALDPAAVVRVAQGVPGVQDCHAVRTRGPEGAVFADLRIHVDPGLTVAAAHDLAHEVEDALRAAFPGLTDIVVHVEPAAPGHP